MLAPRIATWSRTSLQRWLVKSRRAVDKAALRSFDPLLSPSSSTQRLQWPPHANVLVVLRTIRTGSYGRAHPRQIAASKCKCSRWVVHLKLHRLRHACYIDVMKTTAMYVAITILIGSLGATRSAVFVPDSVAPTPPPQVIVQPPLRLSCKTPPAAETPPSPRVRGTEKSTSSHHSESTTVTPSN